jgi:TolA-binding protein
MTGNFKILNGLLIIGLVLATSNVNSQTVVDENRLAAGYYSRQQWPECIESFRALIQRYPDSLEASIAQFYLGEAYMQSDDFRNAYRAFQQYLVKHPASELSARATFRMGEAAYHLGNDVTAIRMLELFIADNPNDELLELALVYLGELRLRRMEPQLAARVLELQLKRYPTGKLATRARLGLARAYLLTGQYQTAINTFQAIADNEDHPMSAAADIQIAHIFLGQQNYEASSQHLLRALNNSIEPDVSTEAGYWLARIAIIKGEYETAFELLEPLVDQPAPPAIAAAICFDAALTAQRLGKPARAQGWLDTFESRFPDSDLADDALHLQIDLISANSDCSIRQRTVELVNLFLREYSQSPWKPAVLEKAARFHYAQQDYARAIEILEQLLRDDKHVDPARAGADRDHWLYLNALGHIGQKDFVGAESLLGRINVATATEEVQTLRQLALATARYGQHKFESAIPAYQNYLSATAKLAEPDQAQIRRARQELTICFAETGLWAESNRELQRLQTEFPGDQAVNETAKYIASRALRSGQSQAAAEILERLVVTNSDSETLPIFLSSLGWLKHEAGENGQACELFQRLIEEFPDHPLSGSAAMCVAKCYETKHQNDRAAQQYAWVIRKFGDTVYGKIARLRRAHALIKSGDKSSHPESFSLLQEYLKSGNELEAKDEALFQLGWVAAELNRRDASIAAYERLLQECPDSKYRPDSSLRLAQSYLNQNKLDLASERLASMEKDAPLAPELRVRRLFLSGEIASRQGRWGDVAVAMERLLPDSDSLRVKTRATYWLGEAAFKQGQFEQAAKHFQFVQDRFEELTQELHPWIWLRLAQSLGKLEKWREAKLVAEEGVLRFPKFGNDFEFDFVIARGLEADGRLSDARDSYDKVIKSPHGGSTETAAIAQWRVGETFFHQENYPLAIKSYYLVDSNYSYPQWRSAALLQAGKCQEHLANWDHAKKLYTRLIEQFPDSEHSNTAQTRLAGLPSRLKALPSKHRNPRSAN